jgi:hypothetical protein
VGSFVSSVGSAVSGSSGLPTDKEIEREAKRRRERSCKVEHRMFLPRTRHGEPLPHHLPARQRDLLMVERGQEPPHADKEEAKKSEKERCAPQIDPQ